MKALSKLLLVLLITISYISCEQIENNSSNNGYIEESEDFYYVRFEAYNINNDGYQMTVRMSLSGYDAYSVQSRGTYITETLGPTTKNAKASISSSCNGLVRIYASKNNGPFALKAENHGNSSYILDF